MKINSTQIKKIHIAKKQLGLTDDQYRSMLSGYIKENGKPAASCLDLNEDQAEIFLSTCKKLGWKPKQRIKNPYEKYRRNDEKFATPEQMLMVFVKWQKKSNEKTEASLNKFAKRIVGKDHISFWLKTDVKKIVKAVENLK